MKCVLTLYLKKKMAVLFPATEKIPGKEAADETDKAVRRIPYRFGKAPKHHSKEEKL